MSRQSQVGGPGGVSLGTMLWRGLRKRCPVCGQKGIFRTWSQLVDNCPRCTYRFSREEGYWVGAIIMNTAAILLLFAILFVGAIVLTAPDVPWQPLLIIALVVNGLFPWLFFPRSKTTWVAADIFMKRNLSAPSLERRRDGIED